MSINNLKRVLVDVVSIDAWHKPFDEKCTVSDLHVDVAFINRARLGGEQESRVRFHLSIKKAEVHIIVPPNELVEIVPHSVARDAPVLHGKQTTTIARKQHAEASAKGALALSANGASATGETAVNAGLSIARGDSTEIQRDIETMRVMHTQMTRRHHRWALEPDVGDSALCGRRWDAVKEPRLQLRDLRKSAKRNFDPIVYVEVRCLRDDLAIEAIELKDEKRWRRLSGRLGHANRIAAAESYIRDRLAKCGIEIQPYSIKEKFGEILLAQLTAIPSGAAKK